MIDEKQIKINLIIVHLYNVFGLENNTDIIHWKKNQGFGAFSLK